MKLVFKRSLTIFLILIVLFLSFNLVSASENIDEINDINIISNQEDIVVEGTEEIEVLESVDNIQNIEDDLNNDKIILGNGINSNKIKTSTSSSTFEDIQNMIDQADKNGVVELSGVYTGNGNLINVNKTLTIKGTSSGAVLDAKFLSSILKISSANVILQNIVFTNSYDISVYANNNGIVIDNCLFNNSINGELGSALSCKGNYITIKNSNFTNNIANKSSCHHTDGPAIYMYGNRCTVDNCNFINNTGYNYETASSGGAIYWYGHDGKILNSNFLNNSATSKFGWTLHGEEQTYLAEGLGGCIWWCGNRGEIINCTFIDGLSHAYAGAIYYKSSTNCSILNSTFINNYAVGEGGAIYLGQNIFNFTIDGTKFINNTSEGLKGVLTSYESKGAAIYSQKFTDNTLINNCLFSNNNNCSIYYLGKNLIVNNSIFENRLINSSGDSNSLNDANNIIFSADDSILENIFWGINYYSPEEFVENRIISINNTYKSPDDWFNLAFNGSEVLNEKGIYDYQLNFVSYNGSIIGSLPIYNVFAKNNVSYNGLKDTSLFIGNETPLKYEYNKAAIDTISIYNNLGDLIISKGIFGGVIFVNNRSDFTKSIQEAIDNAKPDDIIILDSQDFVNVSNVNITKNINIVGVENTVILGDGSGAIFSILPKSKGGPDNVTISNIIFKVNNKDLVVSAIAENDTDPLKIDISSINIQNNSFVLADENVVGESVTILEINSDRPILSPNSIISISDNTISAGINPFSFKVSSVLNDNSVFIPANTTIIEKKSTILEFKDMVTAAVDGDVDGRVGEYFNVTLKDQDGKALANKPMKIGFNGVVYNLETDSNGQAKLQINLGYAGVYTFAICFLGDDEYNASFDVTKITVNTQKGSLTVPNKSYKTNAKTKTISATFKSASGKAVKGKKIKFTVNGKTYTATTNNNGVATVKVSLNKKGTYSFTAKFMGDSRYETLTKTAKLVLK